MQQSKSTLTVNSIISKLNNIDEKSRDYINDIFILINKEIGINKILSIIMFGSKAAKNEESTPISDCDLLIIFKDRVSNRHIKEIEKYFITLEIKHNFNESCLNSNIAKKVLQVIQQTTGMFISHFLTKKKYWDHAIFHKIFRVNKVICKLLAPKKIVILSVIDNSIILHGEDLRDIVKQRVQIPPFDMIKSLLMNLVISIFSILIIPFKSLNSIKYQLEAVKWSLRASNYYSFEDSDCYKNIIRRFTIFEKSSRYKRRAIVFYSRFLNLRKNPRDDIGFQLRCPFRILKIHIKGLLFKKMIQARKIKKA